MKCSGLHCQGCGHRGGNAGVGAGAVLALIVLATTAANRRAIGHAASAAVHVLEVAAAIAVTATVLVIRRRAARRAAASAAAERAEIPASVRVLAPPRRTPAELPAPAPSGRLRWPYVTPDGRRAQ